MEKVTYSSDTTVEVPGAALSVARANLAATGNSTSGYFGGGFNPSLSPSVLSTMDKVTYSTDTTAEVPGAALSVGRQRITATGNSTDGYFGGGADNAFPVTSYSTVDKLTYSTDTTAEVPGAALSVGRYSMGATGNSTDGYFGGGYDGSNFFSTMDKVTYSTDTTAAVPGAALSFAGYQVAATGNQEAGYFGGSSDGPYYSTMDKLTYSTDTTAEVPGAALSRARSAMGATGARANALPVTSVISPFVNVPTPNTGYFGGGHPGSYSTMDKLTYSTDTTAEVPGAALSAG